MKTNSVYSLMLLPLFFFGNSEPIPEMTKKASFLAHNPPLNSAYAHNDYWHDEPLWDALSNGFRFIEVDIHLVQEQLVVAHLSPIFSTNKPTLKELYLQPLFDCYYSTENCKLPQRPVRLMIDIKTDGERTYQFLLKELKTYESMLTKWEDGVRQQGAVEILISGNRPIKMIANEKCRMVSVDGRLSDLGKGYSVELMPIISDRFIKLCRRQLLGLPYSKYELDRIRYFTDLVHEEGKTIRLWGTPEEELTWATLLSAGVDWISTDELEQLSSFLRQEKYATL